MYKDIEQLKKYRKEYGQKNKEKISAYGKAYREKNKEQLTLKRKVYKEINKEKVSLCKKISYQKYKQEVLFRHKQYKQKNKVVLREKGALKYKEKIESQDKKYIKKLFFNKLEVPDELIEAKALQLKIIRELSK